jgi:hypothetical protein
MKSSMHRVLVAFAFSFAVAPLGLGCEPSGEVPLDDTIAPADGEKPLVWSGWTTDGKAPAECGSGRVVRNVDCYGSHCDDVRIDCIAATGIFGMSYYTTPFSEESGNDQRTCNANEWVTGLKCSGDDCDNVSLECTQILNRSVGSCYWSGWFSEETGAFYAPSGYFLRGAKCLGSFCDWMNYYVCRMN